MVKVCGRNKQMVLTLLSPRLKSYYRGFNTYKREGSYVGSQEEGISRLTVMDMILLGYTCLGVPPYLS